MEFQYEPGRFFKLDDQQNLIAEVTFQTADDKPVYILDHTFVDPSLRGQGIAGQLVAAVVELARTNHQQIIPLCSYARQAFDTKPEYADVYYHNPEGANY
ncbi:GNAT family N-acetyltransferase [Lapidilactobacillus bayanensis]|uniref:GNAT family N-acetyltransferase n=1 Tax=Lapidilactobacillus bayanensis TaxID=2485998 RepID=UPI000F7A9807|nr:GNAT family N-acetyltransferase [Lapidilactobacillus bayanensis]